MSSDQPNNGPAAFAVEARSRRLSFWRRGVAAARGFVSSPFAGRHRRLVGGLAVVLSLSGAAIAAGRRVVPHRTGVGEVARARPRSAGGPSTEVEAKQVGPTVDLESFMVQLRPAQADRYARLRLVLEMDSEYSQVAARRRIVRVRAAALEALSDLTADDARGSTGVELIKAIVFDKIVGVLGPGLRAVYVTELTLL